MLDLKFRSGLFERPYADAAQAAAATHTEAAVALALSLQTLLGAEHLFLHIVGAKKRAVLDVAMTPGSIPGLPVRAVLHQSRVPLEIHYAEKA
jgi:6-phosphogluconolactonase/glucosamine-6-phosphate isomerase/deaminase